MFSLRCLTKAILVLSASVIVTSANPHHEHHGEAKRQTSQYLTEASSKYVVDGTALPDVPFDIGETYAGLMPISSAADEERQLYFWFMPSANELAGDEILIWLNGGPGCSSLEAVLQANSPFSWKPGTFAPTANPWSWTNLTNIVWVEQPLGTGFTQGAANATSSAETALQFQGFWRNFVDTFGLQNRKIYIVGESYAGYYIPYIADLFLSSNETETDEAYFGIEGTMLYNPLISYYAIQEQAVAVPFMDKWVAAGLTPLEDDFVSRIHNASQTCGYDDYLAKYLVFPPTEPLPVLLPGSDAQLNWLEGCDVFTDITDAIEVLNPCFSIYQITATCPVLWDVLGFPYSKLYTPPGASVYFNRTDVQSAINAPAGTNWEVCSAKEIYIDGYDSSRPSGLEVLPRVIEQSKRTVIVHGVLDMFFIEQGTLLAIQNMTWNGALGFQEKPATTYRLPKLDTPVSALAGSGKAGTTHTERGLTYVTVDLAGHMVPRYAPSAAYRTVEFLLGRIETLESTAAFSTQ